MFNRGRRGRRRGERRRRRRRGRGGVTGSVVCSIVKEFGGLRTSAIFFCVSFSFCEAGEAG